MTHWKLLASVGLPREDFVVSADGQRFLAVVLEALAGEQPLTIALNWTADVGR